MTLSKNDIPQTPTGRSMLILRPGGSRGWIWMMIPMSLSMGQHGLQVHGIGGIMGSPVVF